MGNKHYFHYSSKGLKDDILFVSKSAFIAGVNRLAVCFLKVPVSVLSFCLMDNHIHLILHGLEKDCNLFIRKYVQLTGMWHKFHSDEGGSFKKKWNIGHWCIPNREKLREKIVYVHRNPTAAFMPFVPSGYRWSSANLMFCDMSIVTDNLKRVKSMSKTEKREIFCSKETVPSDWLVYDDGMIWPGNFIKYKVMEKQFQSARDYLFSLNSNVEKVVDNEMLDSKASLPDSEIISKAKDLSMNMFQERNLRNLDVAQRLAVSGALRKESGASAKQIARAVHLKIDNLQKNEDSQ